MKDYTHLYPGLTPRDAAIVYMHELHDRYMRRKPGVYDCGRPESEQENGCAGCNLRKLLGQPAGFGGGCCGWAGALRLFCAHCPFWGRSGHSCRPAWQAVLPFRA